MHLAYLAAAMLSVAAPGEAAHTGETVMLDFRADWCGPCRQMDPVVSQLIAQGYPVRRVNVDQERPLANRFDLHKGIPCFVLLVNGQEVDRIVGVTGRNDLEEMFRRNGAGPGVNVARGQSPDRRLPPAQAVPFPRSDSRGAFESPHDQLIRASVRLRIEDDHGNSVGSGTIIDAQGGEALIITCGHVFRDAIKGGHIWVDLFGPGAPQGVPGRLIDFDIPSEVGIISIRTSYPVTAARLAPPGYSVHTGDSVVSVGCDGGANATPRETHVTSINRYVGAPNLQVAFQPVQGRSGGGLFTPDGLVVGVCYAADPEANEGLFAALPALHAELDRQGLEFVYREGSGARGRGSEATARGLAATTPNRFATGSDRGLAPPGGAVITPTSAKSPSQLTDRLSPDEEASLAAIRDRAQNAEVICIVRPLDNPQAKSQIIVLDRASPALLQQLTGQSQGKSAPR